MDLSKLFEKSEGTEFTTFPKSLDAYAGYKPVLIFIIGAVVTLALSFVIMSIWGKHDNPVDSIIITSFTIITMIPGIYIATRLMYKIPFSTQIAPIRNWNWSIYIKSFIITLIVYGIFTGAEILITGKSIANSFTIITFLLCLILPIFQGFAEEYLCRGFLMQSFGSWIKIPIIAIIIQATVFAAMHGYGQIASISVVCTGLVYGLITWYGQGLEASSAMHAVNNIFAFLSLGFGLQGSVSEANVPILLVNIVSMVIPVVILIVLDKKYDWGLKTDVN
jgi:membrane protease YdiL (CAAX protease family)